MNSMIKLMRRCKQYNIFTMSSIDELVTCLLKPKQPASVMTVEKSRKYHPIIRLLMVPCTIIVRLVFWMSGGLINLNFGQTSSTESVAFARKLYHCPSTQKILTEYLIKIVEPVLLRDQRSYILKQRQEESKNLEKQQQTEATLSLKKVEKQKQKELEKRLME